MNSVKTNFTSPNVKFELWAKNKYNKFEMLISNKVKRYDSINFAQFVEIDIATLKNPFPGNF